ncbi:threonine--tRNA ligase [Candidatus Gracilibacteria bacterium]|nr:threonine--tRNA ligase [Candidatus Gracilibacteria bacterium]
MIPLSTKRHSLAHIMAQAVKQNFPDAKIATGPDTEDGFYYDFDFGDTEFSDKDLKIIEKTMKKIISQNQDFKTFEVNFDEARDILAQMDEEFKCELVDKIESGDMKNTLPPTPLLTKEGEMSGANGGGPISFYFNVAKGKSNNEDVQNFLAQKSFETFEELDGDQVKTLKFIDMCTGPHVENTRELDANSFKLARVAGAYWLGDADNKQLTRIYAYAFHNKEELDAHLKMLEEAKKRDHRVLGKKLDLFCFSDYVGPGLPLFTPAGVVIRDELQNHIEGVCRKYGFEKVCTPHLSKIDLFKCSGHAYKFSDELFHVGSGHGHEFVLKPVQCPHHTQIYASNPRSYRDLPFRYMESEKQYRAEQSGEVGGLSRVYAITVEDGHVFCRVDQIKDEIINLIHIIREFYTALGMWDKVWVSLSVRDYSNLDNYIGEESDWNVAENMLAEISDELGLDAKRCEGEAALYGPKLDFMFKDATGREIQIPTVQLDFATPQRFELSYKDSNGEDVTPVMIHRAILGSYERFMMLLIEHFAGTFPLWLAPRQVRVIPVAEKFDDYAKKVEQELKAEGFRVAGDYSNDGLNKKVRNAEKMHVNYILVVGEEEQNTSTVSVRDYKTKEQTSENLQDFKQRILEEYREKRL